MASRPTNSLMRRFSPRWTRCRGSAGGTSMAFPSQSSVRYARPFRSPGASARRSTCSSYQRRGEEMIGRLNHVAIAVNDLNRSTALYRDTLGARVSPPLPQLEHGVTVVFVELPNTKIELLEPLGDASPLRGFLDKNPAGGMHHVCYEVDDIIAARDRLRARGARILGDGETRIG